MSEIQGLATAEIAPLQAQFGPNQIELMEEVSRGTIFLNQFNSPLIYILLIVGFVSLALGELMDGSLALAVLVVNVLMGFYQEYSAQKTLLALRNLIKPQATVVRDGRKILIAARDLVPGDIVTLSAGDKIPADGVLLESHKMLTNEAVLTGEEEGQAKDPAKNSRLIMGSIVIGGKGLMKVERIGAETEIGKIGQSITAIKDEETPLQQRLTSFTKMIAWVIVAVCFLIFLVNLWQHYDLWASLKIAIILSIAAIPEALPIALTVILAIGMRRILKKQGLVKKLISIETLGSTSVICTDKTGTLTEGKMQVVRLESESPEDCYRVMTLDNEQKSNLEVALWEYVKKTSSHEPQEIFNQFERIDEEPFDSEKKYSFTLNRVRGEEVSHLMGAPEKVLTFCQLEGGQKQKILEQIEAWAGEGLRLLGLAEKRGGGKDLKDYNWLGLVGIQDPVRSGAKEAIELAQKAGIKIKIVTGDYLKTAERVAASLNFELRPEEMLEGEALEKMPDEELRAKIGNIVLFARVLPHQKLRLVKALQENGERVAMTGDGVNDAPALKKADIGIAVGGATEVAKEASDLILLDSNFKTIVAACEEGRLILANIKKVVGYVLSNSFAEIILIFGAMILGFAAPLTVVQILWIHLICDGPPDILLGFEPKEKDLMSRPPSSIQKEEILSPAMKYLVLTISLTIGLLSLLLFWYAEKHTGDLGLARTLAFTAVGSASLIYIFSYKNLHQSVFSLRNFFANRPLLYGVIYGFALIFIAVYVPFFNRLLGTKPLLWSHWLVVLAIGLVTVFWVELAKFLENRAK